MERIYTNCKHWMMPLCPQRGNESMAKTEPKDPALMQHFTQYDLDIVNKLCNACPKFEKTIN